MMTAAIESYGDVLLEYAAVREAGAGVIDLSDGGRIRVSGTEAVQFLNGLITNDMKTLAVDSWMPAAFPNVQGRLIASVRVVRLQDQGEGKKLSPAFLVDTEAATHESVLKTIERFTLAGDFKVTDVTSESALLSVQGKRSVEVLRKALGQEAADLSPNQVRQVADVTVMRASHTGEDGFDLLVDAEQAAGMWNKLLSAGARPFGNAALEMLRIEAGVPRYGVDMDETNVVTEAALDDAVSYTKGCYVGQEIIARIKYRGHVAKKLSGLAFERALTVPIGAVITSVDGKEVGKVTSATYSPHLGRTIALGYLKFDYLASGTPVKITLGAEEFWANVTELPFVRATAAEEQNVYS